METTLFRNPACTVRVASLPYGKCRISIDPEPGFFVPHHTWETSYPLTLIQEMFATKGIYLCDEIMREEDPRYVEHYLRHEVLGYVDAAEFAGKRVLDFGCGSGASTLVLARILPPCEIVGIELEEKLLNIARLRVAQLGVARNIRLRRSPASDSVPEDLGLFDYVIFSAVFEHLLPHERGTLLPRVWAHVKPGGVLFLNQTPHRWSPMEIHTTGLPLINYLPSVLALHAARRFSKRVRANDDWEALLRDGIRGGTVREILSILSASAETPALLEPRKDIGDQIDLWYGKLSRHHRWVKKSVWCALKVLKAFTGVQLTPELSLAIRKSA